jgi:hypothetical protein
MSTRRRRNNTIDIEERENRIVKSSFSMQEQ